MHPFLQHNMRLYQCLEIPVLQIWINLVITCCSKRGQGAVYGYAVARDDLGQVFELNMG